MSYTEIGFAVIAAVAGFCVASYIYLVIRSALEERR
jgi:hypothetical protein